MSRTQVAGREGDGRRLSMGNEKIDHALQRRAFSATEWVALNAM